MNLDQIGRENQQVFVTRLSKSVSRKSVMNVLCTLSSILKKAKEWGYVCEGVEFNRLVLPEQASKLLRAFSAPMKLVGLSTLHPSHSRRCSLRSR